MSASWFLYPHFLLRFHLAKSRATTFARLRVPPREKDRRYVKNRLHLQESPIHSDCVCACLCVCDVDCARITPLDIENTLLSLFCRCLSHLIRPRVSRKCVDSHLIIQTFSRNISVRVATLWRTRQMPWLLFFSPIQSLYDIVTYQLWMRPVPPLHSLYYPLYSLCTKATTLEVVTKVMARHYNVFTGDRAQDTLTHSRSQPHWLLREFPLCRTTRPKGDQLLIFTPHFSRVSCSWIICRWIICKRKKYDRYSLSNLTFVPALPTE